MPFDANSKFLPPANTEVTFAAVQEPWTVYRLEDGTTLRVRLILVRATETGKLTAEGLPERQCQFQQVMDITPPQAPV